MNTTIRTSTLSIVAAVWVAGCSSSPTASDEPKATASESLVGAPAFESPGAVFTQTNEAGRNELVEYARAPDGSLTLVGRFGTGGTGLGTGLNAQGALVREGRWLFVVNAGSNDVSTFDLASSPPSLVSRVGSSGTQPVSVTAHGGVVYVLNAAEAGNISGFRIGPGGALDAIPGATLPLSATNVTPTEVAFAPDGDTLIVTEKGDNQIDAYHVDETGVAHGPVVNPSDGPAPFGFDFTRWGELVVSEAAQSAASAYTIERDVNLRSISASVLNTQSAACWLVVAPDGRTAFTANAGSGTLSAYRIGQDGQLTLEAAVAASVGADTSHPADMAFAGLGRYLYSLANVAGTITALRVQGGTLTSLGVVDSLPASATGLVAW